MRMDPGDYDAVVREAVRAAVTVVADGIKSVWMRDSGGLSIDTASLAVKAEDGVREALDKYLAKRRNK